MRERPVLTSDDTRTNVDKIVYYSMIVSFVTFVFSLMILALRIRAVSLHVRCSSWSSFASVKDSILAPSPSRTGASSTLAALRLKRCMTVQCEFNHLSMSLAAHAYALRLLVCYDMRDAAIEPSEACENRRVRRVLAGDVVRHV